MENKQPPSYDEIQGAPQIGFNQTIYPPPQNPHMQQPQPGYIVTQQPQPVQQTIIVTAPACPSCRHGALTTSFTCCGICLGIVCFPVGLICCFLMTEKRCVNCGARF